MIATLTGIILLLLFNSLLCIGINRASNYLTVDNCIIEDSKGSLWLLRYYSVKLLGDFWSKPVCTCIRCMASVWSFPFWLFIEFSTFNLIIYLLYIPALSAVNEWVDNMSM